MVNQAEKILAHLRLLKGLIPLDFTAVRDQKI
jgi:hypothetical protein